MGAGGAGWFYEIGCESGCLILICCAQVTLRLQRRSLMSLPAKSVVAKHVASTRQTKMPHISQPTIAWGHQMQDPYYK